MVYIKINKLVYDLIRCSRMDINHISCHRHCKAQIISVTQLQNVIQQMHILNGKKGEDIKSEGSESDVDLEPVDTQRLEELC